ncbi:MAG: 2-amino-4-hydroxy-6-hydroxymethyldihydropteridine diphosphokinase [Anaerolineae bacterium]
MAEDPPRRAYLSLGSNIDKEHNLARAVELLVERVSVASVSSVYETQPVGTTPQESFLNAAVLVETTMSPDDLKTQVLSPIEQELGRVRTADRYGPRSIDVDIVLFDGEEIRTPLQVIPDPEIALRPHLAVPLAELAPDHVHPTTGETLRKIASSLKGKGGISPRPDLDLRALLQHKA